MNFLKLYFFIAIYCITFQSFSQKPIQLDQVLIEHSNKKPKIKKFKYTDNTIINHELFFNHTDVYYLTDSLPIGYIQEITIYFSQLSRQMRFEEWKYGAFKSNKTEFEVTIYEVNDDYTVGNIINDNPIPIVFEEIDKTKLKTKKIVLDLTSYEFKTNRFFVGIKKITETKCDDCYYYAPELQKTEGKNHYIVIEDKLGNKKKDSRNGYMLKSEIKTLTSYY